MVRLDKIIVVGFLLMGCASVKDLQQRRFLDSTTHADNPPTWVTETKVAWEEKEKILIRSTYSVKGNERVNGCYDLAKLDSKENLLSEISNDVRGTLDNAQQSISEDAEVILGKVRSGEFSGRISGLRFTDQYFERYTVGQTERVDCHTLSELKLSDYNRLKRMIVDRVAEVDPKLKEAITKKQIDFFKKEEPKKQEEETE